MGLSRNIVSCIIVGDGMVGKTCLAKKFCGQEIADNYVATIMDTFTGTVSAYGQKYTINIKDTAGQFEDSEMREMVYKESNVCVICYSVLDRDSMESVKSLWVPEIKNFSKKVPIVLVATQSDLREKDNTDHIDRAEGLKLAKELGIEQFVETSSFKNDGVKEAFETVVKALVMNKKRKAKWLKPVFGS